MAMHGLIDALERDPALAAGVNVYQGRLAHQEIAKALGRQVEVHLTASDDLASVIAGAPNGGGK